MANPYWDGSSRTTKHPHWTGEGDDHKEVDWGSLLAILTFLFESQKFLVRAKLVRAEYLAEVDQRRAWSFVLAKPFMLLVELSLALLGFSPAIRSSSCRSTPRPQTTCRDFARSNFAAIA
jgi:hypothetical protein